MINILILHVLIEKIIVKRLKFIFIILIIDLDPFSQIKIELIAKYLKNIILLR